VKANEARKDAMTLKIITAMGGNIEGKTIAVIGLAFKSNTDDMRYAPSLSIIPQLQDRGAHVRAFDPAAMDEASHLFNDVTYTEDPYSCAENADALVILTEWDEFRALDMTRMGNLLSTPCVIDLRNLYKPEDMQDLGVKYFSVGR